MKHAKLHFLLRHDVVGNAVVFRKASMLGHASPLLLTIHAIPTSTADACQSTLLPHKFTQADVSCECSNMLGQADDVCHCKMLWLQAVMVR